MQYAMKALFGILFRKAKPINKSPMPIIGGRFSLEGVSNKLMILGCFFFLWRQEDRHGFFDPWDLAMNLVRGRCW